MVNWFNIELLHMGIVFRQGNQGRKKKTVRPLCNSRLEISISIDIKGIAMSVIDLFALIQID